MAAMQRWMILQRDYVPLPIAGAKAGGGKGGQGKKGKNNAKGKAGEL